MRENKYRAWHKEMKLLYDIELIDFANKFVVPWNTEDEWEFKDIKLIEYTGRKDKYGVEIYESSLCEFELLKGSRIFEIIFKHGAFGILDKEQLQPRFNPLCSYNLSCVKVIGDKFENEELLKNENTKGENDD